MTSFFADLALLCAYIRAWACTRTFKECEVYMGLETVNKYQLIIWKYEEWVCVFDQLGTLWFGFIWTSQFHIFTLDLSPIISINNYTEINIEVNFKKFTEKKIPFYSIFFYLPQFSQVFHIFAFLKIDRSSLLIKRLLQLS